MRDFHHLEVWGRAHRLALALYRVTRSFPKEELYGLTTQIRRAATSVGANIAEGCGRRSDRELRRFLLIAMGSASELEYHLLLASDLGLIDPSSHTTLGKELTGVKRMISGLLNRLKADSQ